MSRARELDPLVGQYQHETHRPRADEALFTLRKIASIVKPIMRRRNWKVGILAEFFPAESNLLGLNTNRGQIINLRLRHASDHRQFLPLEQVLDTMLHELCHNEIGPHNEQFNALWDQLRDEHEALARKGYSGEGFLGRGERLGGARIPLHEAKRRARAAAERRQTTNAGSGQRLGGTGILRGQDARSIIANAVERRIRIERGCASGTDTGRKVAQDEAIKKENVTTTRAEQENENEAAIMQAFIDLIEEEESQLFGKDYIPPSANNPAGPRSQAPTQMNPKAQSLLAQQKEIEKEILNTKPHSSPFTNNSPQAQPIPQSEPLFDPQPPFDPDTWTCEICTLVNPINYLSCDACGIERPQIYSHQEPFPPSPPPPPSRSMKPTPTSNTPSKAPPKQTPNALKPRLSSAQAYQRFEQETVAKVANKPLAWRCGGCGNFMEQEWWTCSVCGKMKSSS